MILIAPVFFISNLIINESISGESLIQDKREINTGKFIQEFNSTGKTILTSVRSVYPTELIQKFDLIDLANHKLLDYNNFLALNSSRFRKQMTYFNLSLSNFSTKANVYDDGKVNINILISK